MSCQLTEKLSKLIYSGKPHTLSNLPSDSPTISWWTHPDWEEFIESSGCNDNMRITLEYKEPIKNVINNLNSRGQSILYVSARWGDFNTFKLISDYSKLDINIKNIDGSTAVIGAAWSRGNIENGESQDLFTVLNNLKSKGANLSLSNNRGETVKNILKYRVDIADGKGLIDKVKNIQSEIDNLFST